MPHADTTLTHEGSPVLPSERGRTLLLGGGGSGRTNLLLSLAEEAIVAGGGVVYVEGNGDAGVAGRVSALAERHGRSADVLVLDLAGGPGASTNTYNPYASVDGRHMADLIEPMLDAPGDAWSWRARALRLARALFPVLAFLRDERLLDLNATSARDALPLRRVIDLTNPDAYPQVPSALRDALKLYLSHLPGYQEEKLYKQGQSTQDQHGFLVAQLVVPLQVVAEEFAGVVAAGDGDIHPEALAGRAPVLVVTLPGRERNEAERAVAGHLAAGLLRELVAADGVTALVDDVPAGSFAAFETCLAACRGGRNGFVLAMRPTCEPGLQGIVARAADLCDARILLRSDEGTPATAPGILPSDTSRADALRGLVSAYEARASTLARLDAEYDLTRLSERMGDALSELEALVRGRVGPSDVATLEPGEAVLVRRGVALRVRVRDMSGVGPVRLALNPGPVPERVRLRREAIERSEAEYAAGIVTLQTAVDGGPDADLPALMALMTQGGHPDDADMVRRAVRTCVDAGGDVP